MVNVPELRNLTLEEILTCPNGHSNQGKKRHETPVAILPNPPALKVTEYDNATLKMEFGVGAVVEFPYHCNDCNTCFGMRKKTFVRGRDHDNA